MKTIAYRNATAKLAVAQPEHGDVSGRWRSSTWLGAPAMGGLALPSAHPSASTLYAPRGVHLGRYQGRDVLIAADTGNHRILIWHDVPTTDQQPCDVVLGQPDTVSEGPAAGGSSTRTGLFLPTGVLLHEDRLVVADAWHHRVLIYDTLPAGACEPDLVLGQADLDAVQANRGRETATRGSMYWPFGVAVVDGVFYVADTGNKRVLGWPGGIPTDASLEPDLILGQSDAVSRDENRGAAAGPDSFRWPHDIAGGDGQLLVADAGNHRILGWTSAPTDDRAADLVLGQADFVSASEWPYAPQRPDSMRFPYAIDIEDGRLACADTANNRVLLWDAVPRGPGIGAGADAVLGQPSFAAAGENRWESVTHDTLCWPYGISLRGDTVAIADSGNNRIMLWRRTGSEG